MSRTCMKIIAVVALILASLTLPITSAISDTTPPSIVGFDFQPNVVDLSNSPQTITFTAWLKDDFSGVSDGEMGGLGVSPSQARFVSPSEKQSADVLFRSQSSNKIWNNSNLVSGDELNGTYISKMTLPQYGEIGTWHLKSFLLVDEAGNTKSVDQLEMIKLGFPTEIKVGVLTPDDTTVVRKSSTVSASMNHSTLTNVTTVKLTPSHVVSNSDHSSYSNRCDQYHINYSISYIEFAKLFYSPPLTTTRRSTIIWGHICTIVPIVSMYINGFATWIGMSCVI